MNDQSKEKRTLISEGIWGADHVRLTVRSDGAEVEFDCAHGVISGPPETDPEGRFDLLGNFVREGGPIRLDQPSKGAPARYSGRVDGTTLTLNIRLTDTDQTLDTYTLRHGSQGRLWKCL